MKAGTELSAPDCEVAVDHAVFERHPGTKFAVLAAPSAPYLDPAGPAQAEEEVVQALRAAFPEEDDLRESPEDTLYREFYRGMGLKAAQVSTPVKQALRVLRKSSYVARGPVVDKAMAIEYSTLVSFQVYAAVRLNGPLSFALAGGDEPITTMGREHKSCKPGELLLLSGDAVMHSCYYGNDPAFLLREEDEAAVVRIMGVPGLADGLFEEVVEEAKRRLSPFDMVILDHSVHSGRLLLRPGVEGGGG